MSSMSLGHFLPTFLPTSFFRDSRLANPFVRPSESFPLSRSPWLQFPSGSWLPRSRCRMSAICQPELGVSLAGFGCRHTRNEASLLITFITQFTDCEERLKAGAQVKGTSLFPCL